jgi:hypothetical protein
MTESLIKALLEERAGYVAQSKGDRVRAVDEQLAFLGYKSKTVETAEVKNDHETASVKKDVKRASK